MNTFIRRNAESERKENVADRQHHDLSVRLQVKIHILTAVCKT